MTPTRGLTLLVAMATASAIVNASSGPAEHAPTVSGARLKTISTRIDAKGAALVIEATDPRFADATGFLHGTGAKGVYDVAE